LSPADRSGSVRGMSCSTPLARRSGTTASQVLIGVAILLLGLLLLGGCVALLGFAWFKAPAPVASPVATVSPPSATTRPMPIAPESDAGPDAEDVDAREGAEGSE